jgi:hypothetical protein
MVFYLQEIVNTSIRNMVKSLHIGANAITPLPDGFEPIVIVIVFAKAGMKQPSLTQTSARPTKKAGRPEGRPERF